MCLGTREALFIRQDPALSHRKREIQEHAAMLSKQQLRHCSRGIVLTVAIENILTTVTLH
jgi:hypothetical protein